VRDAGFARTIVGGRVTETEVVVADVADLTDEHTRRRMRFAQPPDADV